MRQSLEKIKLRIKRSVRKEDILKKYQLSSKDISSSEVEFIDDVDESNDNKLKNKKIKSSGFTNKNGEVIFINKTFFKKIRIEYIDKKALKYLGPIFISSAVFGIILGIIFNF